MNAHSCSKPVFQATVYSILFIFGIAGFYNVAAQTSVTTQHNNLKRTGWNNTETQLTVNNVNSRGFGKIFSRQVDDQVYAQPLVASGIAISGGVHNIVLVATVNNSVYAFDADNAAAGAPYWHTNLTYDSANYRPIVNTDMVNGNYHDFSGNMGIIGTPVIDLATNTIYVVARSVTKTGTTFVQYLHALDIRTGNEKPNSPVYIDAYAKGYGAESSGDSVKFDQQRENPRPGLLFLNGTVYISWASHGDWYPYHGWVIGYDGTTMQQKYVYNVTPNGSEGGIWMSGQAPAVDDSGYIYVTTGNGTTGANNNPNDTINRGESLLKLSVASGNLKVADFFTPADYDYLNTQDLDFGSDGAMLIPNSSLSVSGSKESYLYLIDDQNMGGTTTDNSNVKELLNINASATTYDRHLHGSPVYFQNETGNEFIYAWAEGGLLKQFPFNRNTLLFDTLNEILGNTALPNGMPGAILSVSSNGSQNNSAILWASHPIYGDANNHVVPGILQAFDANDVTHELWNSNWNSLRDSMGKLAKYVPPTIANGKVYVATFSNVLNVYGLNPPPVSACSSGLLLPWQSADIGYVAYPGDVCYKNGRFTITASGANIGSSADAFHFVFQEAITNTLDIKAKVMSVQKSNALAKCGLMFRSSLDAGASSVFMSLTSSGKEEFVQRDMQNIPSKTIDKSIHTFPYWVRIVSNGNKYVGYTSPDGTNWAAIDSVTVALGSHPYVGMAFTANDNTLLDTAIVDSVSIATAGVLPLKLLIFKGNNVQNKSSHLTWVTISETNIDHFDIESSNSTSDFKLITTVKGKGNSVVNRQYAYDDINPYNGYNYYRLKQVDIRGNIQYSPVVKVSFNLSELNIYPNPARNHIYIQNNQFFTGTGPVDLQLFNVRGQQVYKITSPVAGGIITLNVPSSITRGMYVLSITNAKGEKQNRKVYIEK